MAKIQEILEIEKSRKEKRDYNTIHLFKEGSFYHAYEYSAWLIATVTYSEEVRSKTNGKPLSVTRKRTGGDDTFTFVGFPLNSAGKYLNGNTLSPVNDTQIDVVLDFGAYTDDEVDAWCKSFEAWKDSISITEKKKKLEKEAADALSVHPRSITFVLQQVLSYPLERKTPMENTEFISNLKQQLAELF